MERDNTNLHNELMNSKSLSDQLGVEKAILERDAKAHNSKLYEAHSKLDEAARSLNDMEIIRNRLSVEKADFERKLDASESQCGQLQKLRVSLETQLADALRTAEDEARDRMQLLSRYRSVEAERAAIRGHLEDALEEKDDIMRQLSRTNGDVAFWRSK